MREQGMNAIANGHDFLRKALMWILELPWIGEILAKILGYASSKDALANTGEELRQRKSLTELAKFGKVTGLDGKAQDGDYANKT